MRFFLSTLERKSQLLVWALALSALSMGLYGCATTSEPGDRGPEAAEQARQPEEDEASPEGDEKDLAMGEEPNRGGSVDLASKDPQVALQRLRTDEGYEINLYASEQQFPELGNATQMTWDARGRLWVSVMPTYPHQRPGTPPNDKLLVLEDTNRDGRADSLTVFADSLYLPGGFELGNGGVYVAQQPDLMFLEDTDGDGRADTRERILHGFGTGDSHHAISAFEWGPGGALYLMEGTFLYSQVETPHGPQHLRYGGVWRYHPETEKLSVHVSYPFANPWGQAFNFWGQNFLFDASGGANYFALPLTGEVEYPRKHVPMQVYTEQVRPTSGGEIIRTPHFPDSVQGNLLINNVIGFQGAKHHRVVEEGSGYNSEEIDPLFYSTDRNFRPVDLQFGPDGALYVVDWWNPLIGHMQYSLRDPRRDVEHGRIWRITHEDRPLLEDPQIAGRSAEELLDLLTTHTDRGRVLYRVRRELGARPTDEVVTALQDFTEDLSPSDSLYEHHLLEALWTYQRHHVIEEDLLRRLLQSDHPKARAAATRVLRFWRDEVDDALALFSQRVTDPHPRVRLEAVVALSFYESKEAAETALQALNFPVDSYLDYGLRETLKSLEEAWAPALFAGEALAEDTPYGVRYALEQVETSTLVENVSDSVHPAVYREVLSRDDIPSEAQSTALAGVARAHGTSETEALITLLGTLREDSEGLEALSEMVINRGGEALAPHRDQLQSLAVGGESRIARQTGFAALLAAEDAGGSAWRLASKSRRGLNDFLNAVPRVDSATRAALYDRVRPLVDRLPGPLEEQVIAAEDVEIASRAEEAEGPPPRVALLDENGAQGAGALAAEGAGDGAWRVNWEEGHRLIVDLPEDAPRQLDAYEVRARDAEGRIVFASIPSRAHHRSRNLEHGRVTKGPMGNHPKPPLRGQSAIPTADTIAVGGTVAPDAVRKSAIRALASMPVNHAETFRALTDQAVEGHFFYEAARGINQIPSARWPTEDLEGLGQEILARAQETPLEERGSDAFGEVVRLGLSLASRLPDAEREALEDRLDDLVTIITIEAVPGEMRYDKTEFRVPAGKPVVITFRNPDALDHNLVITEPGHMEEVGLMANDMAGTPDAYEKDFIPDTEHVLWYTDLIGADRQDQISFVAPDDPGDYPYLCTFPNHWRTMKGTMTVTNELSTAR